MNRKLVNTARNILFLERDGLSKVRFAKTLYFVHKELIRKGIMLAKDITYIRMPLGPVPDGFMDLDQDTALLVTTKQTSLLYDAKMYKLRDTFGFKPHTNSDAIEQVLQDLRRFDTNVLVELSHKDPSWVSHSNSERYFITPADLQQTLPKRKQTLVSAAQDAQYLQSQLVSGMMHEIVEESTALEYPTDS